MSAAPGLEIVDWKRLGEEEAHWARLAAAVGRVLKQA